MTNRALVSGLLFGAIGGAATGIIFALCVETGASIDTFGPPPGQLLVFTLSALILSALIGIAAAIPVSIIRPSSAICWGREASRERERSAP